MNPFSLDHIFPHHRTSVRWRFVRDLVSGSKITDSPSVSLAGAVPRKSRSLVHPFPMITAHTVLRASLGDPIVFKEHRFLPPFQATDGPG